VLAVFQFDSTSPALLGELLAAGRLPVLEGLRERGEWLTLETPATHLPASTYQTLYSGKHVGEHGAYYPFQWLASEQRLVFRTKVPSPPMVWERASEQGVRSLVIDPYEVARTRRLNGVGISGWQFLNSITMIPAAEPRATGRELERLFGRAPLVVEVFGRPTARSLLRQRDPLLRAPGRVADAAVHLLALERFDLVWLTFASAHLGGHLYWDLSQLGADALKTGARRLLERTLADIYESCDAAIGRVARALPPDADLMVVSPQGMGPNTSRLELLPEMLSAVLGRRRADPGGGLIRRLRSKVPPDARAVVSRALGGRLTRELTARLSLAGVDWSDTRAFLVPSDKFGEIRFNLRGRERDGVLDPADVDALADEIAEGLLTFRDPDGTPTVAGVDRMRDLVGPNAPALDLLPDLLVRWNGRRASPYGVVRSERFGEVRREGVGRGRSGGHTDEAWALLVPGTSVPRDSRRRARVVDVAATVCEVLSVPRGELAGEPLLAAAAAGGPAAAA
jgi:predicted AlkP superfamily phosphohydrolase/phosphomutase